MSSNHNGAHRADLARTAADAAMTAIGVTRLDGGVLGEFATYADGVRVEGVRIGTEDPLGIRLRLVVAYGRPIPQVVADVDTAVRKKLGGQWHPAHINIEIADVEVVPHDEDQDTVRTDNRG